MNFLKSLWNFIKNHPVRCSVTLVLFTLLLVYAIQSYANRSSKFVITYKDHLDDVAVTVNGTDLTLRDMAFYVAYEEEQVNKEAIAYNPDDTYQYWNAHINNNFISYVARDSALHMAIHDEIFYQLAKEEDIALSEDEVVYLENTQEDFWSDLEDRDGAKRMGVEREDIDAALDKVAIAQKMQQIYAEEQNQTYEDYEFTADLYTELEDNNQVDINSDLWSMVDFGRVTLTHEAVEKSSEL